MITAETPPRGYTATKEQLLNRLARIEGRVRGVVRMIEQDHYCIDVIQLSAIQSALDKVGLGLQEGHARVCMRRDAAGGDATTDQVDELMGAVGRLLGR